MAEENIWRFFGDDDVTGYTLIIPSVAVGNVAQLACDLLISSLSMKKIGSAYSIALVPVLGYDPYNLHSNRVSTSCEVYKSTARKIVVLQVRAPIVYRYALEFLRDVIKTFKNKNVNEIIIMTSSFAHENKHILFSPFRFLANDLCVHKDQAKALNWVEHESTEGRLQIFGGGYAAMLFGICKELSMPCLMIYKYCSEGDNIGDAYDMIDHLTGIVSIFDEEGDLLSNIIQPGSWKLLFGRPPPQGIY